MNEYFVYVGNAYPHKNLNRLIEAMVLLNKNINRTVVLKISSSRSVFTKKLEDAIKKFDAGKYVELLGFVPDEKLHELYTNSIAFVFPSLSEGFGLPGLEAMEAGALVLASDIPVFKEVYQNHVAYFDPQSPESISETMKKALEIPSDKKEKIISESRLFAKRYSWAKMARETLKIYEEEGGNSLRSGK